MCDDDLIQFKQLIYPTRGNSFGTACTNKNTTRVHNTKLALTANKLADPRITIISLSLDLFENNLILADLNTNLANLNVVLQEDDWPSIEFINLDLKITIF